MKRSRKGNNQRRSTRSYRGARERPSATAFQHAVTLLNGRSLDHLWKLSTIMSLLEVHERDMTTSGVWQLVNVLKVRLFDEVILRSNASSDRIGMVDSGSLRNILDDLVNAMSDDKALAELQAASGTERDLWEFHRFLARLSSTQIADQDVAVHMRCGLLLAQFTYLPQIHRAKIPAKDQHLVDAVAARIPEVLGGSIREIVMAAFLIFQFYYRRYGMIRGELTPYPPDTGSNASARGIAAERLLRDLVQVAKRQEFVLTPRGLSIYTEGLIPEKHICDALRVLSKTTNQLRELRATHPAYKLGYPSTSLSPLDRYPIVRLDDEISDISRFIVPNIRLLFKALPIALDDTLRIELGDEYNQARGALQELYLRCLIEHDLPALRIIEERQYGKEHRQGPDLTVVDPEKGEFLVIESKARRIAAATRHLLYSELLEENLKGAFDALSKLPAKIEALYAGLPEYADVQPLLSKTKGQEPFCVVVLSDAVFSMSELLRIDIAARPDHPLRSYPCKFAIVGIGTFERAVRVAATTGRSLLSIFEEHWEESGKNVQPSYEKSSANADAIGGATFPESETYAASFLKRAGEEWKRAVLRSH